MEYMAGLFVAFPAVAFPLGFHTFAAEKIIHGLSQIPEEILSACGDEAQRGAS